MTTRIESMQNEIDRRIALESRVRGMLSTLPITQLKDIAEFMGISTEDCPSKQHIAGRIIVGMKR
jgi:hypothetical protein